MMPIVIENNVHYDLYSTKYHTIKTQIKTKTEISDFVLGKFVVDFNLFSIYTVTWSGKPLNYPTMSRQLQQKL